MPYIGVSPQFGVRRKHTYTATASQTSFSGAGAEGATLSYTDSNFVDVYQNGVKLGDADYTSTSGTAIVLGTGATVNDIIEIIVFDAFSAADTVSKADGGQFDGAVNFEGGVVFNETSTDVDFRVESNNQANMLFVDGGNDIVSIVGGGNNTVGGFANTLQIEGTTGSTSSLSITRNTAGTSSPFLQLGKTRGTSVGSNTIVQNGDTLGTITFCGADGTNRDTNGAVIRALVDGTPGENDMPTALQFSTTPDGASSSVERLRITPDGKLGLGTSSPAFQFQNEGTSYFKDNVFIAGGTSKMVSSDSGSNPLIFGINAVEKARITSAGNFGLGTSAPTASSSGPILAIETTSSTEANLVLNTATTGRAGVIEGRRTGRSTTERFAQINFQNTSDNGSLLFYTAPSGSDVSERMKIDEAGDITVTGKVFGSGMVLLQKTSFSTNTSSVNFDVFDDSKYGHYLFYWICNHSPDWSVTAFRFRNSASGNISATNYHNNTSWKSSTGTDTAPTHNSSSYAGNKSYAWLAGNGTAYASHGQGQISFFSDGTDRAMVTGFSQLINRSGTDHYIETWSSCLNHTTDPHTDLTGFSLFGTGGNSSFGRFAVFGVERG